MIEAQISRNDEVIIERMYYEPNLTLELVLKQLEAYIVAEKLNDGAECVVRARFPNLKSNAV